MSPHAPKKPGPGKPRHWLLKVEPEVFSFEDLWKARRRTTSWGGVRNYQARNLLRDALAPGDLALYYHSNADPSGVAGVARIVRGGYPDATQFDPRDPGHDPKSTPEAPRWFAVDVQALRRLPRFVTLAELRADPSLARMELLRRGNRLSVQPVTAGEWRRVLLLGGLEGPLE